MADFTNILQFFKALLNKILNNPSAVQYLETTTVVKPMLKPQTRGFPRIHIHPKISMNQFLMKLLSLNPFIPVFPPLDNIIITY